MGGLLWPSSPARSATARIRRSAASSKSAALAMGAASRQALAHQQCRARGASGEGAGWVPRAITALCKREPWVVSVIGAARPVCLFSAAEPARAAATRINGASCTRARQHSDAQRRTRTRSHRVQHHVSTAPRHSPGRPAHRPGRAPTPPAGRRASPARAAMSLARRCARQLLPLPQLARCFAGDARASSPSQQKVGPRSGAARPPLAAHTARWRRSDSDATPAASCPHTAAAPRRSPAPPPIPPVPPPAADRPRGPLRRAQLRAPARGADQGPGRVHVGHRRQALLRLPVRLLGGQPGPLPPQGACAARACGRVLALGRPAALAGSILLAAPEPCHVQARSGPR
jgi:hypothetical protein